MLESQEGDLEAAIEAMLQMSQEIEPQPATMTAAAAAFVEPVNPVIQRDDQIRADEMLARTMQEQIINETLQEQTPTCFTPITGILGGYQTGRPQASQVHSQGANTGGDYLSTVWNSAYSAVSTVTKTITDTASSWMAAEPASAEEEEGLQGGDAYNSSMGQGGSSRNYNNQQQQQYMNEEDTQSRVHALRLSDTSVSHRRKPASKKSD